MRSQAQRRCQTRANKGQRPRVNQQVFHITVILQRPILQEEKLFETSTAAVEVALTSNPAEGVESQRWQKKKKRRSNHKYDFF